MRIKILIIILFMLPLIVSSRQVMAEKSKEAQVIPVEIEAKKLDKKAEILALYLAKYDSPLKYHAQDFIDAANLFGLDWRMLPAIAGVESTFGKNIPGGYNGWGWGVYGSQAIYFNSWREGIFTIAKGLRENYLNKGLREPYSINRAYATSPKWGFKVAYFMTDIDKFASSFEKDQEKLTLIGKTSNIAAISGQLALR